MQRLAYFIRDESGFVRDGSGTTSVEYSVMLGFIIAVVIGAVAVFGQGQNGKWGGIWGQMQSHGM